MDAETTGNNLVAKEHIDKYLAQPLDPALKGVRDKFKLVEEFRTFLWRNEDVLNHTRPDVGFLLFLVEQQRFAIINLEERVAKLEDKC